MHPQDREADDHSSDAASNSGKCYLLVSSVAIRELWLELPASPSASVMASPEKIESGTTLQRRYALEQLVGARATVLTHRARVTAFVRLLVARAAAAIVPAKKNITVARWLGLGLSAGCVIALLSFSIGNFFQQRQSPRVAAATPAELPSSAPPVLFASTAVTPALANSVSPQDGLMPTAEIAVDEMVVRASTTLLVEAKANARVELDARQMMVSGRAVAAVIMLKRTGSTYGEARVRCKTLPGTATAAQDYQSITTTVQFADGQAMRTLFVPILQPPPPGESRTFSVMLEREPRGPSLGKVTRTTVTIVGEG